MAGTRRLDATTSDPTGLWCGGRVAVLLPTMWTPNWTPLREAAMNGPRFGFVTTCIDSDYESIQALMASELSITRGQFRHRIGQEQWQWLQETLGYDRHFPITKDWHVGYYEGVYQGQPAVFLRHSKIEWIFVELGK